MLTSFGPRTDGHAYAYTETDDTFSGGHGDVLMRVDSTREREAEFDLASTCFNPPRPAETKPIETEPPMESSTSSTDSGA